VAQDYSGNIQIAVVYDQTEVDDLADLRPTLPENRSITTVANSRSPGLAGGRNTGIGIAEGEYVAFCDDDDEWNRAKLSSQISAWERTPEAAMVCTGITIVTLDGEIERTPPPMTTREDLLSSRVGEIHPSSFLFRRLDLLQLEGGIDEEIPFGYGEDYDLLLRITETGGILGVPEPLAIIHWDRDSYFAGRWDSMAGGLSFLLEKHPDLLHDRRNAARMSGQIAFAHAARGDRGSARTWARRTLENRKTEPRAWLALLALTPVAKPKTIIGALNKRGRGI
jgi:glycosyltransferase involved in cell wall biosynthesis